MQRKPASRRSKAVTFETVRQIALTLPGAEESTSYGTPAFKVKGKLFVRLHQDGDALVVGVEEHERAKRMLDDPETFFITDHYRDHPWILVRLAKVKRDDLHHLLAEAWRLVAPKSLLAEGMDQ